jgi:hypothetical protein
MSGDSAIRQQLVKTLRGGNAFDPFDEILAAVPSNGRFTRVNGEGRSAWEIVEHMRRSIEDLCDFTDNADGSYREKEWPREYWPEAAEPDGNESWDGSLEAYRAAIQRMEGLILDSGRRLTAAFPWGDGQSLLHEALLAIEHNAYHLGELVELMAALGD